MSGTDDLRKKVHRYALNRRGKKVGAGDCTDLPKAALRKFGAKKAYDYDEEINDKSVYQWGKSIDIGAAQPGDILQFDMHIPILIDEIETQIEFGLGEFIEYFSTDERKFRRRHHSAIVHTQLRNGEMLVLEQNVNKKEFVAIRKIYVTKKPKVTKQSWIRIKITPSWAKVVKSLQKRKEDKKFVNHLLKKYKGKTFDAHQKVTSSVVQQGEIHAYSPEPK